MSPEPGYKESKFTRGEKCIFVHVVITLAIIITLLIIYIIHVCLVKHRGTEFFKVSRRWHEKRLELNIDYQTIGVVYLNMTPARVICNTLLIKSEWSLAPGQCTAMREDPDMAEYIPFWQIKYKDGIEQYYESGIKRSLTHSHFNRDDYNSNIGLFQHQDPTPLKEYVIPSNLIISDEVLKNHNNHMNIIGWNLRLSDKGMDVSIRNARPLAKGKCAMFITPLIDELRKYEFCATFERTGAALDHGAMFVMDSTIIGFFSWGDIEGRGVPLVILKVSFFREWFENIIS